MKPEVMDKFDGDYWVDAYADSLGIDPRYIVSGKQVALVRQQRAEQQRAQQQMAAAQQMASVAKDLGKGAMETPTPAEIDQNFMGF